MTPFTAVTLAGHARACIASSAERSEAALITRLDAGEPYDEGSTLEADILTHCRLHGDFTWVDADGCATCFGDVSGRAQ